MLGDFDIATYCKSNLNRTSVTGSKQITAVCPWCDKYGGFYVDIKTGNYICFKCEEKGRRLVGLVAEIEGVTWSEAQSFLMQRAVKFRRRTTPLTLLEKISKISGKEDDKVERVECELPEKMIKI